MKKSIVTTGLIAFIVASLPASAANANNLWQSLSLKNALVFKNGNGSKKLAMVTDIDCGYCRMLEQELSKLDDVTIYKFLTPIQGGYTQSVSIWCAADRNSAYLRVLNQQENLRMSSCSNPISSNLAWFYRHRLVGAPALIAQDGRVHYGYANVKELKQWLD